MKQVEIRCLKCDKKLAEGRYISINIKCPRCKKINELRASEFQNTGELSDVKKSIKSNR